MHEIQELLFPEMRCDGHLLKFSQALEAWRLKQDAHLEFVRQIRTAIGGTGSSRLIAVGCSPAFDTSRLARDILPSLSAEADSWGAENGVLELSIPPLVGGARKQIEQLHDRYREKCGIVGLRSKHREKFQLEPLSAFSWPRSQTEALISSLRRHGVSIVFLRDAQNLHPADPNARYVGGLWHHIADIAKQSGIPHVVIGDISTVCGAAESPLLANDLEVVLQRMYLPEIRNDRIKFCAMLKGLERDLGSASALDLAQRVEPIMARVGGDPMRLFQWLQDASCQARRFKETTVTWEHFKLAAPTKAQAEASSKATTAYHKHLASRICDFPLPGDPPPPPEAGAGNSEVKPPKPTKGKPFQRNLESRDRAFNAA